MNETKINTKNIILALLSLGLLISVFLIVYKTLKPKSSDGEKTFQFSVEVEGEKLLSAEIKTKAEYLRQVLEEEELISGTDNVYGLWITTVYGREADSAKEEWWCLYINGDFATTGVDDTPLESGMNIEFKLIV